MHQTKEQKPEKTKASRPAPSAPRHRISVSAPRTMTQERIDEHVANLAAHWVPQYEPLSTSANSRMTDSMAAKYYEAGVLVAELAAELGYKRGLARIRRSAPWASVPPNEGKSIPALESELYKYKYARRQLMLGNDVDLVDPERLEYTPPLPDASLGTDEDLEDLIFWAQERGDIGDLDHYWREAKARQWPRQKMNEMFGGKHEH